MPVSHGCPIMREKERGREEKRERGGSREIEGQEKKGLRGRNRAEKMRGRDQG